MELKALVLPFQSTKFDDLSADSLRLLDQLFVLHFEQVNARDIDPVLDHTIILLVVEGKVVEVRREDVHLGVQRGHKAGQTSVHRISPDIDDAGARRDELNEADVLPCFECFVDKSKVVACELFSFTQVNVAELVQPFFCDGVDAVRVRSLGMKILVRVDRDAVDDVDFADADRLGVGADNFFNERASRARHAGDKYGQLRSMRRLGHVFQVLL